MCRACSSAPRAGTPRRELRSCAATRLYSSSVCDDDSVRRSAISPSPRTVFRTSLSRSSGSSIVVASRARASSWAGRRSCSRTDFATPRADADTERWRRSLRRYSREHEARDPTEVPTHRRPERNRWSVSALRSMSSRATTVRSSSCGISSITRTRTSPKSSVGRSTPRGAFTHVRSRSCRRVLRHCIAFADPGRFRSSRGAPIQSVRPSRPGCGGQMRP